MVATVTYDASKTASQNITDASSNMGIAAQFTKGFYE